MSFYKQFQYKPKRDNFLSKEVLNQPKKNGGF